MEYERFSGTRRSAPSKVPCVRVNSEGRFSFDKAATLFFKHHNGRWVSLNRDKSGAKKIAVQIQKTASTSDAEIKYRNEAGTSGFNHKSFAQWAGIDLSKSNTYPVEWNQERKALEFSIENSSTSLEAVPRGQRKTSK
jgi:hypothetical protein